MLLFMGKYTFILTAGRAHIKLLLASIPNLLGNVNSEISWYWKMKFINLIGMSVRGIINNEVINKRVRMWIHYV